MNVLITSVFVAGFILGSEYQRLRQRRKQRELQAELERLKAKSDALKQSVKDNS